MTDKEVVMAIAVSYTLNELGWKEAAAVAAIEDNYGNYLVLLDGIVDGGYREYALLIEWTGKEWEVTNETEKSDFELNASQKKHCNYCNKLVEVREITYGVCKECHDAGIES